MNHGQFLVCDQSRLSHTQRRRIALVFALANYRSVSNDALAPRANVEVVASRFCCPVGTEEVYEKKIYMWHLLC